MSASPRSRPPLVAVLGPVLVTTLEAALLALGLGGAGVMVRDPRALALLALSLAGGWALQALRPTRGHDAVRVERDPLPMLILFVVPLLAPMLGAWAMREGVAVLPRALAWSWAGVALVGAGLALRIAAMARLGPRFSPLVAVQREHALETRGLYGWVRHPGYLGALLACLGAALAFGSTAALPLVLAFAAAQRQRIRREEALLAAHFGEAWRAYAARTGALLPGLGRGPVPRP
jgi:protein-S-isoprenylcysteine O-methyltransferase Ste14